MHPTLVVPGGPTELASRLNLAGIVLVGGVDLIAVRIFGGGRTSAGRDRFTYQVIQALQLAALAGAFVAAYRVPALELPGNAYAWVGSGLALMVGGALLRAWAIATLGRRFRRVVAVDADHEVVTSGPYRWLRHPSYTGALGSMLGVGVALDNAIALALLGLLPFVGYLYRIRVEEAALEDELGDRYRSFAAPRKRLIPGVY